MNQSSNQFEVVVVGSANLDLVANATRLPKPGETIIGRHFFESCGGKGVNQAIAASRAGANTAFVGAIGPDHAGETLRTALLSDGVNLAGLHTVTQPTGRALIGVGDDGENSIIVIPGANHQLTCNDIESQADVISTAKVLLCQLEVPLEVVQFAVQIAGSETICILNPAPAQPLPAELLCHLDLIIPNEHEIELLGGSQLLLDSGVATVVVTQGSRGALIITKKNQAHVDPLVVTPVDSTGAGDAFCGTVAACLSRESSVVEAIHAGVVAGALATLVHGAVPSLPLWSMVSAKLESR